MSVQTIRLSAPVVTIEVLQNQSGLHATVFTSIDPSHLNHSFASCRCSLHSRHETHFSQRVQLFLSSFLHFFGVVKDCRSFRLPGIVIPRIRFQHKSPVAQECVHRSSDTNPRSPPFTVSVFPRQSSFDRLVGKRGCSLLCGSLRRRPLLHGSGLLCFCALLAFACARSSRRHGIVWWLSLHLFVSRWLLSSSFSCTSGAAGGGARGSAAGGMSNVIDFDFCRVSTSDRRSSTDQLCSAIRRTLRAYSTPSSVPTRCSSVMPFLPSLTPGFHLSASFGAGFPDPFATSER